MNKKGRLYIHLGPPKTATTSFQYFLQDLNHPEIEYFGIYQPRSNKKISTGKALYDAIMKNDLIVQKEVSSLINKFLESGKS